MIEMRNVSYRYPSNRDFQLHIPEWHVGRGRRVAIVGPSGTGKSTLLNLIAAILTPQTGDVRVEGESVTSMTESRRRAFRVQRMGLVFQSFELLDYLSVWDNVLLPYRIHRSLQLDQAVRRRAERLLERVGLSKLVRRSVRRLSQGERQRVALCRAVVTRPGLLLADEPTGNLDRENKQIVLGLLMDCCQELGSTLLTVTHDLELLGAFDETIQFDALNVQHRELACNDE